MLPKPNTEWPPAVEIGNWWDRLDEWEVWFTGDTALLEEFYRERNFNAQNAKRFWAGVKLDNQRALHLPVAGDVAATSASLLFSEMAVIEPEATGEAAARLEAIIEENSLDAFLLEAAELAAALGGIYLKIDTDPELVPTPVVVQVKPSACVPVFRRGRLWEATFWRVVKQDSGNWWYLFEERTNPTGAALQIRYKLFRGSEGSLGKEEDSLDAIEETRALGLQDTVIPTEGLGTIYLPNMRPNRYAPGNPQGMSDYASCITLMDALDEAWTSWMRDVRLGMGKLLVDKEFFTDVDTAHFDHFQETFVKLNLGQLRLGSGDKYEPIKHVQFELRVEDHLKTCMTLLGEIVDRAGYNPQTFGLDIQGIAQSGTALRIRERKSMMTRQKKSRYWQAAIKQLLWQLQRYDVATSMASSSYEPVGVTVELQDSVTTDAKEVSETVLNLRNAQAISQETAVRLANPDWDDRQVTEELARLADEKPAAIEVFPGEKDTAGDEGDETEEG